MEKLLENKRVIQMFVGKNGRMLFCARFSAEGEILEGGSRDLLLMEQLSRLAAAQPHISGKAVEGFSIGKAEYTVEMNRYIDCNGAELVEALQKNYGNLTAVSDPIERKKLSYTELVGLSGALAKSLISLGIRAGEHVAVIMNNCWEQIVVKLALVRIGALADNINYHEAPEKIRDQLKNDDCTAAIIKQRIRQRNLMENFSAFAPEVFTQAPESLRVEELPKLKMLAACGTEKFASAFYHLEELIETGRKLDDALLMQRSRELSPLCPGSIIHTSGSTGKPKSVLLNHAQLLENALSHQKELKLREDDRFCMTSPMFHALGSVGSMLTALLSGACLICYEKGADKSLLEILKEEKATVLCAVPIIYIRLCSEIRKRAEAGPPDGIRLCVTAGAPCPPELVEDIKKTIGAHDVIGMYGMTETSPGITSHALGDPLEVICNTVGHFWEGVEVKITDPETGEPAAPLVPGEICVRGYMVMQGYYNNPVSTAKLIDPEGWVHTGDLGYIREDGNLKLEGRIKEIIIRGAENISPLEVEACLRANDQVLDVAVVGAPDREYGEQVCAFVVPAGKETIDTEELKNWCRGRIATIKIPQKVVLLKEMPVLPTGKIDKNSLKEMAKSETKKKQ